MGKNSYGLPEVDIEKLFSDIGKAKENKAADIMEQQEAAKREKKKNSFFGGAEEIPESVKGSDLDKLEQQIDAEIAMMKNKKVPIKSPKRKDFLAGESNQQSMAGYAKKAEKDIDSIKPLPKKDEDREKAPVIHPDRSDNRIPSQNAGDKQVPPLNNQKSVTSLGNNAAKKVPIMDAPTVQTVALTKQETHTESIVPAVQEQEEKTRIANEKLKEMLPNIGPIPSQKTNSDIPINSSTETATRQNSPLPVDIIDIDELDIDELELGPDIDIDSLDIDFDAIDKAEKEEKKNNPVSVSDTNTNFKKAATNVTSDTDEQKEHQGTGPQIVAAPIGKRQEQTKRTVRSGPAQNVCYFKFVKNKDMTFSYVSVFVSGADVNSIVAKTEKDISLYRAIFKGALSMVSMVAESDCPEIYIKVSPDILSILRENLNNGISHEWSQECVSFISEYKEMADTKFVHLQPIDDEEPYELLDILTILNGEKRKDDVK